MDGGHGAAGGGSSDSVEGEEDQDESSSSNLRDSTALESFRREWKREIADSRSDKYQPFNATKRLNETTVEYNVEDKAKTLFQLGVENEERGRLYEAIQYYKKAFQLVPDIELKMAQQASTSVQEKAEINIDDERVIDDEEDSESLVCDDSENEDDSEFDPSKCDLLTFLQGWMYRRRKRNVCSPHHPTNGERHFSDLPMEVILYIFRWVVGTELDLRSLEQMGAVSRGLYVCSRDPEIWRLACTRVWGLRCTTIGTYPSWRDMFIFRARVKTGGCYISKTTYIRPGETSFQDQFYRPWHLVQYFRYLRFFADGTVIMLTSSEEPVTCVGLLKRKYLGGTPTRFNTPIFYGYYRLLDQNIVSIIVSPHINNKMKVNNANRQTFHLELEIVTLKNRLHCQLVWRRYALFSRNNAGTETNTNFELIANRYPPFWYSRVKSYHNESHTPLV